jgi:hypothetical protein
LSGFFEPPVFSLAEDGSGPGLLSVVRSAVAATFFSLAGSAF